jgi:hypothetical protein
LEEKQESESVENYFREDESSKEGIDQESEKVMLTKEFKYSL